MDYINLIGMIRKQKLALLRLEKISESSSPTSSPKRKQTISQRCNPMALTTITLKDSPSPPKHKNNEISALQEEIMVKRQQYSLWDQAQNNRNSQTDQLPELFSNLLKNCLFLAGYNLEAKRCLLRAMKRGHKGVIRWLLCLIRELFWIVFSTLMQRRARK